MKAAAPSANRLVAISDDMSVASGSYCTDAVSTATTSTARASPARTMSRARRRQVAPQKHPLKFSSCFCVSSESPSSWMRAAEMPGSDHPLVQVVTTCVMSDTEPPQLAIASRAASIASLGALSIQKRARRLPGGSKPCGVKMSSTSVRTFLLGKPARRPNAAS